MVGTTHNVDQHAAIVRFEHTAIGTEPVECEQHGSTSEKFEPGTSSVVWPVSLLLARHLCETPSLVQGKSCVELGSGIGMVGLVAAALGASSVVLTDVGRAMPVLESNAARGRARNGAECLAAELEWGDDAQVDAVGRSAFDVVLAADVLIAGWAETHHSLASTMRALLKPVVGVVLLGFEYREEWDTVASFTDTCAELGMHVDSVQLDEGPDLPDDFYLYTITLVDLDAPAAPPATRADSVHGDEGEDAPSYTFGL